MAQFPEKSNVVIIGLGGIVGASVIHHLVERGWEDIVGIDKTSVPTDIGSTSHASDFCYATEAPTMPPRPIMTTSDFSGNCAMTILPMAVGRRRRC